MKINYHKQAPITVPMLLDLGFEKLKRATPNLHPTQETMYMDPNGVIVTTRKRFYFDKPTFILGKKEVKTLKDFQQALL